MQAAFAKFLQLYLAGYLLTLTYAKTSQAGNIITIIHFTLSVLSPVASVVCAEMDCASFANEVVDSCSSDLRQFVFIALHR